MWLSWLDTAGHSWNVDHVDIWQLGEKGITHQLWIEVLTSSFKIMDPLKQKV